MTAQEILKLIEEVSPDDTAKLDEIWRPVVDYEGLYEVSNYGRIRNLRTSKYKKIQVNNKGYCRVSLYGHGETKTFSLARLVTNAFLGKSDLTIDHLDMNKSNNHISNLEYVSQRENVHRLHGKRSNNPRGVYFYKKRNGAKKYRAQISVGFKKRTIGWYATIEEASEAYKNALQAIEYERNNA